MPKQPRRTEHPSLGILYMLFAFVMFTGIDTLSKLMGQDGYHPVQISWGRLVIQLILLLPFVMRTGFKQVVSTGHPYMQTVRGIVMIIAAIAFVAGLETLPLATMTSINFVSPFLITILSIFFLKEHVGYHRWVAIAIGFTGALIVIRPGAGAFDIGALYALTAALAWAVGVVTTRYVQREDNALTTIFYTVAIGTVVSSFIVAPYWKPIEGNALYYLVGIGLLSTAGQLLMIASLRHAEPSVVAPFTYTQLIWATLIGYVVFGDFPDSWTWIGSGIIIASGLYVWHRERQLDITPSSTTIRASAVPFESRRPDE